MHHRGTSWWTGGVEQLGGHPHGALSEQLHVLSSLHDDYWSLMEHQPLDGDLLDDIQGGDVQKLNAPYIQHYTQYKLESTENT